ncbi:carboxylesterase family protein [Qipengyuania flava]|uniref:carboxylesterase family protein n=1 Tax=Qipengyuania flava TaxID=192812 RepID=UPI001C6391AE|nr:alpha/beta hydrolase-fold protein [Qipengyuania flava]QYJ07031.1 dienelactone hydrolase family protein [Qipengyuania flava]
MKKPVAAALIAASLALPALAIAQEETPSAALMDEAAPRADGVLSEPEAALAPRPFPVQLRFDNPDVKAPRIDYRVGYTATHLYVAITTSADSVTYRNRGWLWGDGWRIILTDSALGPRSARFIELIISPRAEGDTRRELAMAVQDGEQVYRALSPASTVAEARIADGTLFEARIAWADLAPFHPLFDPAIGLNLYFAKAFETAETGPFAYGHALVADEAIFDEGILSRRGVPLRFGDSGTAEGGGVWRLATRTVVAGQPLMLESPVSFRDTAAPRARMEGVGVLDAAPAGGSARWTIDTATMAPGIHALTLPGSDTATEVFVLPPLGTQALREHAQANAETVGPAGIESIHFLTTDFEQRLARLQPYADGSELVKDAVRLTAISARLNAGEDPFPPSDSPMRRGFRSLLDGSHQPYSLRLPEGFDPARTYPAMVFLHGSGTDDRGLLDRARSNGRFVEIAPGGRDSYLAYASPAAQWDIREALDKAGEAYAIDREKVVIGGFSMGGYGALRAFYENPERYAGVAVFAGHPNLANEWLGGGFPNFLEPEFLKPFAGVPVFIYHGKKDAALPFALAEQLAAALEEAGAVVTFSPSEENGHVYQDAATQARFDTWLKQFE